MTKKQFVRRAMQMRPTAEQWRELVARVVDYNNLVDYKNAPDDFSAVHPLVGAMHEHFARWHIDGSCFEAKRREARRMANKYHCII